MHDELMNEYDLSHTRRWLFSMVVRELMATRQFLERRTELTRQLAEVLDDLDQASNKYVCRVDDALTAAREAGLLKDEAKR